MCNLYLNLKRAFTTGIVFFFISSVCIGQSNKKLLELGNEATEQKDFYSAKQLYKGAYQRDSSDVKLWSLLAKSAYSAYDFSLADYLYKKLIKKDNGKNFPLSFMEYGHVLKAIGKYKDANAQYNKFIRKQSSKKLKAEYTNEIANCKSQITACETAIGELNEKTAITVSRLDSNISTLYSELGGQFINEKDIIYTKPKIEGKGKEGNEVRYEIIKKENSKEKKKGFTVLLSDPQFSYANFSYDSIENIGVCTKCNFTKTNTDCQLIGLHYKNKLWEEDLTVTKLLDKSATQGHLTRLNNGLSLFYIANNANNGTDIFVSKLTNGQFENGVRLNENINSLYNEISPFYSLRDSTLFFSSDRSDGIGGFDIYKSRNLNANFEKAVRLKPPYNGAYNDMYFSIEEKSRKVMITSNRKGAYTLYDEGCCNDMFESIYPSDTLAKKPLDTLQTIINKIKLISPISLFFDNDEPDKRTTATSTTKTYEMAFTAYLNNKISYISNYAEDVAIEKKLLAKDAIETFYEDSVEQGMENLKLFCVSLQEIVKANKKVKVILKAYTSSLASNAYNTNLAARRISSLKNYFETYNGGALLPYLNLNDSSTIGKIELIELKIGELTAPKSSEDLEDLKNSVYSPAAMSERKIEIISIELEDKQ
jgi:outer membrane protein OmpA-like peptidoglycan-associated protein